MKRYSIFKISVALFTMVLFFTSCYKEEITIGSAASDYFYVERNGASMMTLVRGNTESKKFLLIIHGGPGDSGISYYNPDMNKYIESRYAVAYYDQRDAGASQGNDNMKDISLENMVEDVRGLIKVLKKRYGQDIDIYMMGHSFGGLLSSAFMTTDNYQEMVKGWIYVDGAHDYTKNDSLTRLMLISEGEKQIALGKNIEEWGEIMQYCNEHPGNFSVEESMKYNSLAWKAQSLIEEIHKPESLGFPPLNSPTMMVPVTAKLSALVANGDFIKDIVHAGYCDVLYKVKLPVLIIYGKYDFVCPKGLGEELISLISSEDKQMVISEVSSHVPMNEDPEFFYSQVIGFIKNH